MEVETTPWTGSSPLRILRSNHNVNSQPPLILHHPLPSTVSHPSNHRVLSPPAIWARQTTLNGTNAGNSPIIVAIIRGSPPSTTLPYLLARQKTTKHEARCLGWVAHTVSQSYGKGSRCSIKSGRDESHSNLKVFPRLLQDFARTSLPRVALHRNLSLISCHVSRSQCIQRAVEKGDPVVDSCMVHYQPFRVYHLRQMQCNIPPAEPMTSQVLRGPVRPCHLRICAESLGAGTRHCEPWSCPGRPSLWAHLVPLLMFWLISHLHGSLPSLLSSSLHHRASNDPFSTPNIPYFPS